MPSWRLTGAWSCGVQPSSTYAMRVAVEQNAIVSSGTARHMSSMPWTQPPVVIHWLGTVSIDVIAGEASFHVQVGVPGTQPVDVGSIAIAAMLGAVASRGMSHAVPT